MSPWLSDLLVGSQSDDRLVTLARAGNERAFSAIVERYRPELLAVARRMDRAGRADDIVQQTLLSAFSALRAGSEVRHLRGWLHAILRNTASGTAAGDARTVEELGAAEVPGESVHQAAERRMLARAALGEIAQLPSRQRDALVQTALQGRSRLEVATAMGLSEGAVRQLVHRARASLRTAVSALTPLPLLQWASAPNVATQTSLSPASAGLGAASVGGVALKLGSLIAAGAVAAGLVLPPLGHSPARLSRRGHAAAGSSGGGAASSRLVSARGPRVRGEAITSVSGHELLAASRAPTAGAGHPVALTRAGAPSSRPSSGRGSGQEPGSGETSHSGSTEGGSGSGGGELRTGSSGSTQTASGGTDGGPGPSGSDGATVSSSPVSGSGDGGGMGATTSGGTSGTSGDGGSSGGDGSSSGGGTTTTAAPLAAPTLVSDGGGSGTR